MRVCIIGSGNVGTHLGRALYEAGHEVTGVFSRQIARATALGAKVSAPGTNNYAELNRDCDIVILAVYDDAIGRVYEACSHFFPNQLFLHTAGSVPTTVFDMRSRCGVLWPVQTLSASHTISMRGVPIAVTGISEEVANVVEEFARSISDLVYRLDDNARLTVHLAATFANNFSNHMYTVASRIMSERQIPFEILLPIIEETAAKIRRMSPEEAQTGAAKRGDTRTMEAHLNRIKHDPELADLYWRLSDSIRHLY